MATAWSKLSSICANLAITRPDRENTTIGIHTMRRAETLMMRMRWARKMGKSTWPAR